MFGQHHHPRKARRRETPEQLLHRAVAEYLRHALKPPVFWTTFPAGGGGAVRGGILKGLGLRAGVPDLLVILPQPIGVATGSLVVGIELKTDSGRASAEQLDTHTDMTMAGCRIGVCRSVEQVEALLERHGVPLRAKLMGGGGIMKVAA